MNHIDIFELATVFAKDMTDKDEAYFRNIIGRCYYSVYHHAVSVLEVKLKWNASEDKFGVHERVISRLDNYPKSTHSNRLKEIERLKEDIVKLKKARTKSDYRLLAIVLEADAAYMIKLSERIIKNLDQL